MVQREKGGFVVKSHTGKTLTKVYKTKAEAVKRLGQIEYFKHKAK